jgi:hypothetical protein
MLDWIFSAALVVLMFGIIYRLNERLNKAEREIGLRNQMLETTKIMPRL